MSTRRPAFPEVKTEPASSAEVRAWWSGRGVIAHHPGLRGATMSQTRMPLLIPVLRLVSSEDACADGSKSEV